MSERTPGPWTFRTLRHGSDEYDIHTITGQGWAGGGRTVADIGDWLDRPDGNAEADTKFIVNAVNNHDGMVATLQDIARQAEDETFGIQADRLTAIANQAHAVLDAIKEAKGIK